MKLMQKILLSCKEVTFFSSVRNFRRLKFVNRIQLKLHLILCKNCAEFDKQSRIIDKTLLEFQNNSQLLSEETLTLEKISQIKTSVNQCIK